MVSIITARSKDGVIGYKNALPWGKIPQDMKHFREITLGKTVVMGRKTFESIGKPLSGRTNIVLSRDTNFHPDGCAVFSSISDILVAYVDTPEIVVIGGASIYEQFLPYTYRLYVTFIDGLFEGDAYFPIRDFSDWKKISGKTIYSDKNPKYKIHFAVFERK